MQSEPSIRLQYRPLEAVYPYVSLFHITSTLSTTAAVYSTSLGERYATPVGYVFSAFNFFTASYQTVSIKKENWKEFRL
jgi:hypothetical protein